MTTQAAYFRAYRAQRHAGFGPIVSCACGCGATFRQLDGHNKRARRYVSGHNGPRAQIRECRCGCGRRGRLIKGYVSICYQRLWRAQRKLMQGGMAS